MTIIISHATLLALLCKVYCNVTAHIVLIQHIYLLKYMMMPLQAQEERGDRYRCRKRKRENFQEGKVALLITSKGTSKVGNNCQIKVSNMMVTFLCDTESCI